MSQRFATRVLSYERRVGQRGKAAGRTWMRLNIASTYPTDYIDLPSRFEEKHCAYLVGKWILASFILDTRADGRPWPRLTFLDLNPDMESIMSFNPTPAQQAIIDVIANEPNTSVRVDARAGASKTSTIVLAAQNIGPQHTPLAVAFNKKIAEELESRLPPHFTCKTLNGLGHQAWAARLNKRLQVDADKMYKLARSMNLDPKQEDLFSEVLTLARAAKSVGLIPIGSAMNMVGLIADTDAAWNDIGLSKGLLDVTDEGRFYARELVRRSIAAAWKGEIDFDDQIYMSTLYGGVYPKFHTVIVDEAQDLSALNHLQIVKLTGTRAIVVGDPFQAIYGFRGADSDSINNLVSELTVAGISNWKTLPLSLSFRVPKAISARQTRWVPDFGSMDFLPEGKVEHWPRQLREDEADSQPVQSWSLDSIPQHGAVLCRNNAPLMALAFAMIKQRRPVKILGRDIGASIASLLLKITGKSSKPVNDCFALIDQWKEKEVAKAGDSESKLDAIYDRHEALFVLLDASGKGTNLEAADFIRELFTDKADDYKTTFSSIHRSKGLEWDWVMMLDPHRIPSKMAEKAKRNGDPRPLQQEYNLRYVGETRTKGTLVLASLSDCLEVGA